MASDDEKEKPEDESNIESVEVDEKKEVKVDKSDSEAENHHSRSELGDSEAVMSDKEPPKNDGKIKRFFRGYWHKKLWTVPLTLLVLAGIFLVVPTTRYPAFAAFGMKRQYGVIIFDSKTNSLVSEATVTLNGMTVTSNTKGLALFNAKVGKGTITVSKKYYKTFSKDIFVGVYNTQYNSSRVNLDATGRQVPVTVVNKLTGQLIENAEVKILDTSANTDHSGKAIIVLPTGSATLTGKISATGYNDLNGTVQVTDDVVAANTFKMTPSGKVYFLSDQSGNIDVVSTNLDGSDRKTALAGTGKEDQGNTVLLASRDWKYLALLSKRDDGNFAKLYLIDTSNNNKLITMDEGSADFGLVGWSGHNFVYTVNRATVKNWQNGQQALKTYAADTNKMTTIEQSTGTGNADGWIARQIGFSQIVNDRVVYGMAWQANNSYDEGRLIQNRNNSIISVNADGSNKNDLKDIKIPTTPSGMLDYYNTTYLSAVAKDSETLYIQHSLSSYSRSQSSYYIYKYDDNAVSQSNLISSDIYNKAQQNQTTYLASPSNKQALWYLVRDGKNNIYIGDYDGSNGKVIATGTDYITYGWYTDNYILLEKSGSELYVMAPTAGAKAMKISDYYKPPHSFYGYGGGYGGL